ncbi:MAG: hypothetical protein GF383_00475 [Candidatus Lokiarchaeota archaeon]|nr:hypothetical protein [Candidatus Lokiarchaeota archaeon]MBD3337631.1 hypothetical protein [Candidatus Lokiarchaeota archaeon]
MPKESDFKTKFEELTKSIEGNRYYHDIYLKAVNHPIRREILRILSGVKQMSKEDLFSSLKKMKIVEDKSTFNYNFDYLKQALCIEIVEDSDLGKKYVKLTQSGKVIDFLE